MERKIIYTVGHSTHPAPYFLELLKSYGVDCLIDVRSLAASRFNPQYNKKALSEFLNKKGIEYHHMPDEFGARQTDPKMLSNGKVDFEKVRNSDAFKNGLKKLQELSDKGKSMALMCSESEPLNCHRFVMICSVIKKYYQVWHILKDKNLKPNAELEDELIESYFGKREVDLFDGSLSREEQLEKVLEQKNQEMGYMKK
jgi:uncharacterized protein (DUF488 family)